MEGEGRSWKHVDILEEIGEDLERFAPRGRVEEELHVVRREHVGLARAGALDERGGDVHEEAAQVGAAELDAQRLVHDAVAVAVLVGDGGERGEEIFPAGGGAVAHLGDAGKREDGRREEEMEGDGGSWKVAEASHLGDAGEHVGAVDNVKGVVPEWKEMEDVRRKWKM